ncbi:MAG: nucleotide-binding protein [Lachnospiraceae bacterium]|nr:nucleotide-binding protein [Lachnospiraceae bacterium]
MKQFKIFYSWQSDLPNKRNRNIIDSCIKKAVAKCNKFVKGFEIVSDRDTQGVTGSPNISETIFSKIDECDLFIADVSIVSSYTVKQNPNTENDINDNLENDDKSSDLSFENAKKKYTPNPNVLIELGYAVKCLGWNRVICLINTDYGDIEQLPFDLEHQRVTAYNLDDTERTKKQYQILLLILF